MHRGTAPDMHMGERKVARTKLKKELNFVISSQREVGVLQADWQLQSCLEAFLGKVRVAKALVQGSMLASASQLNSHTCTSQHISHHCFLSPSS